MSGLCSRQKGSLPDGSTVHAIIQLSISGNELHSRVGKYWVALVLPDIRWIPRRMVNLNIHHIPRSEVDIWYTYRSQCWSFQWSTSTTPRTNSVVRAIYIMIIGSDQWTHQILDPSLITGAMDIYLRCSKWRQPTLGLTLYKSDDKNTSSQKALNIRNVSPKKPTWTINIWKWMREWGLGNVNLDILRKESY